MMAAVLMESFLEEVRNEARPSPAGAGAASRHLDYLWVFRDAGQTPNLEPELV